MSIAAPLITRVLLTAMMAAALTVPSLGRPCCDGHADAGRPGAAMVPPPTACCGASHAGAPGDPATPTDEDRPAPTPCACLMVCCTKAAVSAADPLSFLPDAPAKPMPPHSERVPACRTPDGVFHPPRI